MEMIYYFGDWMLLKGEGMRGFNYVFNGANPIDGQWEIHLTFTTSEGYAGGGADISLQVSPGDVVRMGEGMKARIKETGTFKEKKRSLKVAAMRFDTIERDCIKVWFDLA